MTLWVEPAIPVALVLQSTEIIAGVTAAAVTALIGGLLMVLRYVFDVQLMTSDDVQRMIDQANSTRENDFNEIIKRLDGHKDALDKLEKLIMGSEYQVSDGMLELVEVNAENVEGHEDRIDGVERIQLKIRRRQREHTGGEDVAGPEDVNPPPDYNENVSQREDSEDDE